MAQNIKIFVNNGTGFLVSRSGHILTNLHVVDYCERIIIGGAVSPRRATIIGRDVQHDLALLKVDAMGVDPGLFRSASVPVEKDERVVIVGYPGKSAQEGRTVTREAQILSNKGPKGEDSWVQLSDIVEQGNSGGPLLDAYGNVIGVIVAKAVIYTYRQSDPEHGTYSNSGIAIAAPVAEEFLSTYSVPFYRSDANAPLSADRLTDKARRFVVSVRCESMTELR